MFKKITFFLSILLPFGQSFAGQLEWEESLETFAALPRSHVKATWRDPLLEGKLLLNSVRSLNSDGSLKHSLPFPWQAIYPNPEQATLSFKMQHIDRLAIKNPYHLYEIKHQSEEDEAVTIGYAQFDRMPTAVPGYPEGTKENPQAYHSIIRKFISLGVTKQKEANAGLNRHNIERIENRGIAMISLLFDSRTLPLYRSSSIQACYELIGEFKKKNKTLPIESTVPYVVMSLLRPDNLTIKSFEESGFDVSHDESFGLLYSSEGIPQPRTMVTRFVD
jgi:hypothetical protein